MTSFRPWAFIPWALLGLLTIAIPPGTTRAEPPMPAMLKGNFPSFSTPLPESAQAWEQQKSALRRKLWSLLGDLPPRPVPAVKTVERHDRGGYMLERFSFDNGAGDTVYGYVLVPEGHRGRGPAILYNHYHGGSYELGKDELLTPAFAAYGDPTRINGEELVRAGYVVLGIDAYAFGQRQAQGPAGEREQGGPTEQALFKTFLWEGRTLWGMMVRDDQLALDCLLARPEVDPARVATLGMSMGSTRSWWLAALDERIKVVVAVSCLTRYQDLIAAGHLNNHGAYYFVPGMLKAGIDTEAVVGLIAPRPLLTLTGDSDAGSPLSGVRTINGFQERLYAMYGQEQDFRGVVYPGVGHVWSPEMWRETLAWLKEHL